MPTDPIEFDRRHDNGSLVRVGNRVQIEDSAGSPVDENNPLHVQVIGDLLGGSDAPVISITRAHQAIHDGITFIAWYVVPHATPIPDDGTVDIVVIPDPAKELHMVFSIAAGATSEARLFALPVYTGGTAFTPVNLNQNSSNTSNTQVITTPTITNPGIPGPHDFIPGGGIIRPSQTGMTARSLTEGIFIVPFLLRLTNRGGVAVTAQYGVTLQWYEVNRV
jgi:hypothetical protein